MRVRIEWKPQDCWIGAFWKAGHLWVCIVPMLPIHFYRLSNEGGAMGHCEKVRGNDQHRRIEEGDGGDS